ncbi:MULTISPECIES: DNA primase [Micrococcus]|uniref:DNA primase n=1 Tax=Micrococcus lylae TaxID=1273 RepID=A0ABY2K252_9MICC|nr:MULTISPECIES: DNA primase [Micrococcus]OFR90851.1 DNA primase [Micrococcus sp. HMSC067E09]PNL17549.1 DNA primase [Micrococcus sp. FDAARGOS_333]TFI01244.1 DNA primase [Micrococcus lylae]
MAGLIVRKDIDLVRERADLKAIVEEYVTLRSAGVGSFKGLCPFHDERTPSFHIRPAVGTYHCFGCGEHGDVISFLMELEHTTFTETVERLAARVGVELHYEDGGTGPDKAEVGRRRRLIEANKIADELFVKALGSAEAQTARDFLTERGFTAEHARQFGLGYAPQGWSHLLDALRKRGFRDEELRATGLFSEGQRGLYDRFRGRLVWPIRDMTGNTIGFGARKLYEDDPGPKYLNTPETALYKKSQVLYGIDFAKRTIAKQRQLVVVEGYTDVMAAHLAGIGTAVATCGTAFGTEHIKIVRRLISDDGTGGEVIFTFDGDEAGQKAALKAFEEDHRFLAKTYVAVEPSGMDPCDLRRHKGDEAVRALISSRRPLFEFAIRSGLKDYDLDTVEGRAGALRHAAPIVAGIKDSVLRPGYERELAGWLGMDPNVVHRAVAQASRRQAPGPAPRQENAPGRGEPAGGGEGPASGNVAPRPQVQIVRVDPRDPVARRERESLEVVLQHPTLLSAEQWQAFYEARFTVPQYAAVHRGIMTAATGGATPQVWVESISDHVPPEVRGVVSALAVRDIPARTEADVVRYCRDIMNRLFGLQIQHRKAELLGQLQRLGAGGDPAEFSRLNTELMELEARRRALRSDD